MPTLKSKKTGKTVTITRKVKPKTKSKYGKKALS